MVQLHGDEGLSFCHEVTRRTGCPVIKAIRVRSSADIDFARSFRVNFHLLDAYREGMPGGTGHTIDWELLRRRRSKVPLDPRRRPHAPRTSARRSTLTRPCAVDVASGVESAPGIKDHELMTAFAAAAEEAGGPSGAAARSTSPITSSSRWRRTLPSARPRPPSALRLRQAEAPSAAEREPPPAMSRPWRRRPAPSRESKHERGARDPLRRLRRPLRPRGADGGARRAVGRLGRGARGRGVPGRAPAPAPRLRRAPDPALPRRPPVRARGPQGLSQARGPDQHRRPQDQQRRSARRSSPSGWASRA